jgi:hypothetical protein
MVTGAMPAVMPSGGVGKRTSAICYRNRESVLRGEGRRPAHLEADGVDEEAGGGRERRQWRR